MNGRLIGLEICIMRLVNLETSSTIFTKYSKFRMQAVTCLQVVEKSELIASARKVHNV